MGDADVSPTGPKSPGREHREIRPWRVCRTRPGFAGQEERPAHSRAA